MVRVRGVVKAVIGAMDLRPCIADLFSLAHIDAKVEKIQPLAVSGNNRSYLVTAMDKHYVAKQYFSHVSDNRDRLASEFSFLSYAKRVAPKWVPAPLAAVPLNRMALYEFVAGRNVYPDEVTKNHVDAAASFFLALNVPKYRLEAQLPLASEACFSINDHLNLIEARLENLVALDQKVPEDSDAYGLVQTIKAFWQGLKVEIELGARENGIDPEEVLEPEQRCVSPSDFGLHNALVQANGQLRFLDFEYAGWDDPAKMAGDFFAQLAVPVPLEHFEHFVETCLGPFPRPEALLARARLLRPAYQIKWCCIALNVFLPVSLVRRKFADPELDERALKKTQIIKAKQLFQSIIAGNHGLH